MVRPVISCSIAKLYLFLEIGRIGDGKKIYQVEYLLEEQLIIVLAGRQRQMRLIPIRALDQTDTEWIKVADTKGCIGMLNLFLLPKSTKFCFSVCDWCNATNSYFHCFLLSLCCREETSYNL